MTNDEAIQLLISAGFTDGWAVAGDVLILWEHDEEPPAPLVRPDEAPAPSADSAE